MVEPEHAILPELKPVTEVFAISSRTVSVR
jgi:hypothetical protein